MRIVIYLPILVLFALSALAVSSQKAVIVMYPKETPDTVINEAMETIRAAGGMITHEYHLFRGFAANAPAKVLETIKELRKQFQPLIEDDFIVSIEGDVGDTSTN